MIQKNGNVEPFVGFSKTQEKHYKELYSLIFSGVIGLLVTVGIIYAYDILDSDLAWIIVIFPLIILVGNGVKILYDIRHDEPYLYFTEKQFYYDDDGREKRHFWRDVVDIFEEPHRKLAGKKTVIFTLKSGKQFIIDPEIVKFDSSDIIAIAREFLAKTQTKV